MGRIAGPGSPTASAAAIARIGLTRFPRRRGYSACFVKRDRRLIRAGDHRLEIAVNILAFPLKIILDIHSGWSRLARGLMLDSLSYAVSVNPYLARLANGFEECQTSGEGRLVVPCARATRI